MARTAASRHLMAGQQPRHGLLDGPSLIIPLFLFALVIGVIVGLGANHLSQTRLSHQSGHAASRQDANVPAAAERLGYRNGPDFWNDEARAASALQEVLAAEAGAQRLWQNPETGNRGNIWASAETTRPGGESCRNLERRTLINGAFRNAQATACRRGAAWDQTVEWQAE